MSMFLTVRISKPSSTPDAVLNVNFHNVTLEMKSRYQSAAIVYMDDTDFCKVSFNDTKMNYLTDSTHNNYYCLAISNRVTRGCNITISNGCVFSGWGAIYNRGSSVKLTARNSTFVGENHYATETHNDFATITVADYPMSMSAISSAGRRSWSANNDFNFINCELIANAASSTTPVNHQFVIQCRCPANNIVSMDSLTWSSTISYRIGAADPWFATAFKVDDVSNANIEAYFSERVSPAHPERFPRYDMPAGIATTEQYYAYYAVANGNMSHFVVDGKSVTSSERHFKYYSNLAISGDHHDWVDE